MRNQTNCKYFRELFAIYDVIDAHDVWYKVTIDNSVCTNLQTNNAYNIQFITRTPLFYPVAIGIILLQLHFVQFIHITSFNLGSMFGVWCVVCVHLYMLWWQWLPADNNGIIVNRIYLISMNVIRESIHSSHSGSHSEFINNSYILNNTDHFISFKFDKWLQAGHSFEIRLKKTIPTL